MNPTNVSTTKWNLIEFSELEEPVLTEFTSQFQGRRRHGHPLTAVLSRAARTIGVVTLASGLSVMPICAQSTAQQFAMPYLQTVAHGGLEMESPLADLFSERFSGEWSQAREDALLARAYETKKQFSKAELEDQTVFSLFFNQHEEPSDSADKLTAEQIRKIVKQRKLV